MRAAFYAQSGTAAEVIRIGEVETPRPGPGEVRVRVRYSGINPTDWKSRSGATAGPVDGYQIPHHDGVGVIDEIGSGVDPARIGERVWLWMAAAGRRWGTAAEWTVVPSAQAVRLPDGASDELGAALGVPALTAHRCLAWDGLPRGGSVLVAGGAGAVGHFAIQLAKWMGARVATTVSGPDKADLAAAAGADLVVNYRQSGALDELRRFAAVMDRIVEVNLGHNLAMDLALGGPQSVIVTYAASGPDPELPVRACMTANATLRFMLLYSVPRAALEAGVRDITDAITAGALSELPVHRYPLERCAEAQDAVESGAVGKVLLELS